MPEAPGVDLFKKGSRYNWTKTQFAGPKVHIAVCAVLRYVKQRYAPELEVKEREYTVTSPSASGSMDQTHIGVRFINTVLLMKAIDIIRSCGLSPELGPSLRHQKHKTLWLA
jgi:hypothetical protein